MTKKILVVEDEAASRKILRYSLGREGYETAGAKDGIEAMELLGQLRFDLVLSDLRMPRMGGLAVSAKTKSDSDDKVLVVQKQPKSCGKEARRYDNSR
jgi:CheY-like chemotaxis protein